jgi:hypothetical protein
MRSNLHDSRVSKCHSGEITMRRLELRADVPKCRHAFLLALFVFPQMRDGRLKASRGGAGIALAQSVRRGRVPRRAAGRTRRTL